MRLLEVECKLSVCVKKHDSQKWTGVPRDRVFVFFVDEHMGGDNAIDWIESAWEHMSAALSTEEPVANHAVVSAVAGGYFESSARQIKAHLHKR